MSEELFKPSVAELKEDVIDMLKTIYDPEIPVNIYELGLIYVIDISESFVVDIKMTLTAPGCPVAQTFPGEIEAKVGSVPGVGEAHVEVIWEPTWTKDMMSEAAQLQLGFF
ncbi:MAG: SUF system Fe-S cluster assembly protein [Piscirickettsiaceae bacterium]|jgi:FeS assembly SUF system protein|nr:SUF system Fe-S cluster assembly protein [Piscirickettsiaceae bacterium]